MKNGLPRYAEWNYGPQKWMMNHFKMTHSSKGKLYDQFKLTLAQQSFEESRISRNFNDDERETRIENVSAYSVNIDLNKKVGKKNKLNYGAEYVLNDVSSRGIK